MSSTTYLHRPKTASGGPTVRPNTKTKRTHTHTEKPPWPFFLRAHQHTATKRRSTAATWDTTTGAWLNASPRRKSSAAVNGAAPAAFLTALRSFVGGGVLVWVWFHPIAKRLHQKV